MKYSYQINENGEIYSSRIKAHRRVCNVSGKDCDDFLPCKERISKKCKSWIEIIYPNDYRITKRRLL